MYGGRKQRRGPFRWCDFPVFFSVLSPIQMVHAKRGNIARDRRQQQRIHQPSTASGGKVLASQLSWHCEGVVRTGKRYLPHTALHLRSSPRAGVGARAAGKRGQGRGYPWETSDSPTCQEDYGAWLRRGFSADNSHTELFITGSLGCA